MARKKSEDYFEAFVELSEFSRQAANLLETIMNDFHPQQLQEKMREMHEIEHNGDTQRHVMIEKLAREFITPIEREDIMALADAIDNVTDTVEDVLMRMYMCNITTVREDALQLTAVVVKCCNAMKAAFDEFPYFRKSQTLHGLIVDINRLEEDGDILFTEAMRNLYLNCKDSIEITTWDQIYFYLEKCCDSCEEVANAIESVIMKNS